MLVTLAERAKLLHSPKEIKHRRKQNKSPAAHKHVPLVIDFILFSTFVGMVSHDTRPFPFVFHDSHMAWLLATDVLQIAHT